MNVAVHLVSMPWATPIMPSIQLGALHAYLDRAFSGHVPIHSYSAFYAIPRALAGSRMHAAFKGLASFGEHLYFAAYAKRFGLPGRRPSRISIASLVRSMNRKGRPKAKTDLVARVADATVKHVESRIAPSLAQDAINVIGFTVNYDQVYASLFVVRHLMQSHRDKRMVFLFGGMSASLPEVVALFRVLGIPAFCVVGEGERTVTRVVDRLRGLSGGMATTDARIRRAITGVPGIFHVDDEVDLHERDLAFYEGQLASMETLPLPDYDEFFETVRAAAPDEAAYAAARRALGVPAEGTRGCFAKCDFCGLNNVWDGFRKQTPSRIADDVTRLVEKYGVPRVHFMDNVCDTWAEGYADAILARGMRLATYLELRAHHNEAFFTKLALSGADWIQIGVEALAPHLLAEMKKGTRVVQNVSAQKYLAELGLLSGSALITHHPRSSVADVDETRRVLEHIPHLEPFILNRYRVVTGSPLFSALSPEERKAVVPMLEPRPSPAFAKYLIGFGYELPPSLALRADVERAWDAFRKWYPRYVKPRIDVARLDQLRPSPSKDRLLLHDTRFLRAEEHVLQGAAGRLYDACHKAQTRERLAVALGLREAEVDAILDDLTGRRVLLKLDEHYVSLALRPRDELISRHFRAAQALPTRAITPAPKRLAVVR